MEVIELSAELKVQVENIKCTCNRARLTFQRVTYDKGFNVDNGGSVVVDAYCKSCKVDSSVIVHMPES